MTPGTLEQISLFLLIVQDSEEAAAGEVVFDGIILAAGLRARL